MDNSSDTEFPQLRFDGASSGNPGPAGYGIVLEIGGDAITDSVYIGEATNNQAEYHGLIAGLKLARDHGVSHLDVRGDSQLVIRQMTGEYSVNNEHLRRLHGRACELAQRFDEVQFQWVSRENTGRVDELARKARKK